MLSRSKNKRESYFMMIIYYFFIGEVPLIERCMIQLLPDLLSRPTFSVIRCGSIDSFSVARTIDWLSFIKLVHSKLDLLVLSLLPLSCLMFSSIFWVSTSPNCNY